MEFEDLDIPAWVQKAWLQPLAKGDILFRSVPSLIIRSTFRLGT